MNRDNKELVVQKLKNDFASNEASFLVNYKGLTVAQVQALRKKLRTQGGDFKVVKARLMKLAVQGIAGIDELIPYFKDQVALVFVNKEVSPVAKTLVDFSKENKALTLVIGCNEKQLMQVNDIQLLANLPSREVLLAQLCGVLAAPMAQLARVVNIISEQKEKTA